MYSPGFGPTRQRCRRALYPATFRNMAPYEDPYLDHDMTYPTLPSPSQDPYADSANMLPGIVPMSDQVSDGPSPVPYDAASVNGSDGEDSDTSPLTKLLASAEIPTGNEDDERSGVDDVNFPSGPVQQDDKEHAKSMSAYALFFRDKQEAIKLQNPYATFAEVSQIVGSMWEQLEPEQKLEYKTKIKAATMEYHEAPTENRTELTTNGTDDQLGINRSSGYMVSPPSTMRVPPRDSLSPLQNSNPLLSSAIGDGSPRDYMEVASPEDVLSTKQQRFMVPNSASTLQKPKQAMRMPKRCSPQQTNSDHALALGCASYRKPERSPSLCKRAPSSVAGPINSQCTLPEFTFTRCRRNGCPNPPVPSNEWDVEYCSSECVILHCKDVFSAWAAQRQAADPVLPP
ncbi:hypothetical protein HPB50_018863 [Hyalomma asiaticum]|uniref:Uncharacterized protein n=1 Tax=Hyalomma asiaticum TaxID=266040 RepID=A0ACB7S3S2_HYAAI|nr:hypothetical protein HPB50_018863 [Hyalomma asiaticum]